MTPDTDSPGAKGTRSRPPEFSAELKNLKQALKRERTAADRRARKKPAAAGEGVTARERLFERYTALVAQLRTELSEVRQLAESAGLVEPERSPAAPGPGPRPGAKGGPVTPKGTGADIGEEFGKFLHSMGEAMVRAQQQLDAESRKYLAGATGAALPAVFRLPRLNAEVRFEFERNTEGGLNFVFYRKDSGSKELRQHALDFEIVAVPAPPGFTGTIPAWRPLVGAERVAALGTVRPSLASVLQLENDADVMRVVAWSIERGDGNRSLLLSYAPSGEAAVVRLAIAGVDGSALLTQELREAAGSPGAPASGLVALLRDLSVRQPLLG